MCVDPYGGEFCRLVSFNFELQKMGCTRDARIVVANRLLALPRELIRRQVEVLRHEFPKIVLDGLLVLGCRRNDLRVKDYALLVNTIAMVKNATWRFAAAVSRG
jgi:hypothetical protein